jgi:hypothetical protein
MEILISTKGEVLPKSNNKVLNKGRLSRNSQIINMNTYSANQVVPAQRKIGGWKNDYLFLDKRLPDLKDVVATTGQPVQDPPWT